jgi:hypothetical protein
MEAQAPAATQSRRDAAAVKDWIVNHAQLAAESWYVAHPDLTVAEIHRIKRIGKAVEEFLDKVGG